MSCCHNFTTVIIAIPITSSKYVAYIVVQCKQLVMCTQSTQCSKQRMCSMSLDKNAENEENP